MLSASERETRQNTIGRSILVISVYHSVWFVLKKNISDKHLAHSNPVCSRNTTIPGNICNSQRSNAYSPYAGLSLTWHWTYQLRFFFFPNSWNCSRNCYSKQSAVKCTEKISKRPLGLKCARCIRTKAFHFCISDLFFSVCKEFLLWDLPCCYSLVRRICKKASLVDILSGKRGREEPRRNPLYFFTVELFAGRFEGIRWRHGDLWRPRFNPLLLLGYFLFR